MRAETQNKTADMNQTKGSFWLLTITSPENLMPLETAIDGCVHQMRCQLKSIAGIITNYRYGFTMLRIVAL